MKGLSLSIILILISTHFGLSQVEVNEQCKTAYHNILALKFDEALSELALEKNNNPENLYAIYLENYIDFLSVFISEDEDLFDKLEDNKSDRIDRIKKLDDSSPYKNYMLGNINLQWAVARLKFQEYFTAAFEINRAYRLLRSNAEQFPDFAPNNISLGVLHIMIGMVPQKYHWLLSLVNMEGSVEQGREELFSVLSKTNTEPASAYLKNETLFYLGFVELNITPDTESLNEIQRQLVRVDPSVLLLSYLNISMYMRSGQNEGALSLFNRLPDRDGYFPFYYLDYLESECYLRKLDVINAESGYTIFLDNFEGKNYIKDSWRKKGWIALLNDDSVLYRKTMISTFGFGNTDVGQDKDAQLEAETKMIPNINLVKARLLFDGGYYQKTDSIIAQTDTSALSRDEQIECEYRLARSNHQQGKIEEAKSYYENTITNGSGSDRYFAGNSALKLGEIYEQEKDTSKAMFYYGLCLELKFNEYESGIHSKAKAGLKRLSD